jgi:hypothetical protein
VRHKPNESHLFCHTTDSLVLTPPLGDSWSSVLLLLLLLLLQVAKDLGDKVQILKLDVDKNPSMSTRLQVGGTSAQLRQANCRCTCALTCWFTSTQRSNTSCCQP